MCTFAFTSIGPPPSHTDVLFSSPSSLATSFVVGRKLCNAAPSPPVCTRRLLVRDDIIGGKFPLIASLRRAGATGPPKSVRSAATPALSCVSTSGSNGVSCVSFSESDGASCVSSLGSDGVSCVYCSDNASCISCLRPCDADCLFSSSSFISSCGASMLKTVSYLLGFKLRFSSSTPSLPVLSGPSIYCTAYFFIMFLACTSSTPTMLLGKFRGILMNAHLSSFGTILCLCTLPRAYPTAPNGRK